MLTGLVLYAAASLVATVLFCLLLRAGAVEDQRRHRALMAELRRLEVQQAREYRASYEASRRAAADPEFMAMLRHQAEIVRERNRP